MEILQNFVAFSEYMNFNSKNYEGAPRIEKKMIGTTFKLQFYVKYAVSI